MSVEQTLMYINMQNGLEKSGKGTKEIIIIVQNQGDIGLR